MASSYTDESAAARATASEAQARFEEIGESVQGAAGRFADDLRSAATSLIDEQKGRLAERAQGFAAALRRAAGAFEQEGSGFVARCTEEAADRVEELAQSVRQQGWREMLTSIEDVARQRPELFFAGAIAAGFVVGRLIAGSAAAAERP